jgi:hypothetical protein
MSLTASSGSAIREGVADCPGEKVVLEQRDIDAMPSTSSEVPK